ncbi:hypothetical protein LB577_00075 [Mesorhizobium sp. B283B1A]|uniref:hypothetical protein n=1 Tax=Mesorhizobium TaxID=68287 RepID=UPI001CD07C26|nr:MULTISPECIES: hypothetical protein [Mesorhizobium]MCA0045359.1 hypothetical protein [Mesorhizobium sp. B283B1A]UQS63622.1 hypothetical protein M5D98_26410 [Mesorhizobium opportunistum]WJI39783.1 hypothetical protein NL534_05860 [Mesorhizobium opportunistum]
MNTTTWLREARERFGGGVPASGRKASLAVFGTIGPVLAGRCPNSPLPAGFVFISPYRLISQRIPCGRVGANMAKLTTRQSIARQPDGQPL